MMRTRLLLPTAVAFAIAVTSVPLSARQSGGAKPTTQKPANRTPSRPNRHRQAGAAQPGAAHAVEAHRGCAGHLQERTSTRRAGSFVVEVHRDWAPKGADRFYNLVRNGFYDDSRFFRVVPNFMVQFGINGNPAIQKVWRDANITDDPVTQTNKRGAITFATAGAEHAHEPGVHQLPQQREARQARVRAVRRGDLGHGSRGQDQRASTASSPIRAGSRLRGTGT